MKDKQSGAICGDGMCPYIPCEKFPECNHVNKVFERIGFPYGVLK